MSEIEQGVPVPTEQAKVTDAYDVVVDLSIAKPGLVIGHMIFNGTETPLDIYRVGTSQVAINLCRHLPGDNDHKPTPRMDDKCSMCKGSGQIQSECDSNPHCAALHWIKCPGCLGSGKFA